MQKVLVTGATGFIGKHVITALLQQNVQVIASSRNIERDIFFEHTPVIKKAFDLHQPDLNKNLFEYFEQPDIIIHLAWEGLPNYKDSFHLDENLPAHISFLSRLIKKGANNLTVTGTCFEYGMQEGCLQEEMPALPGNAYAHAKDKLRQELELFQNQYNLSLKWLRLFYMYGEGQNSKSLISQLDHALEKNEAVFNMSGGEQTRDFLPVEAVADAIVKIALQKEVTGIINISSNNPVSVKEFVSRYIQSKNKQIQLNLGFYPYPDFEPMHFWGDNTKLKSIN